MPGSIIQLLSMGKQDMHLSALGISKYELDFIKNQLIQFIINDLSNVIINYLI